MSCNFAPFTTPEVPGIADLLALLPATPSPAIDIPDVIPDLLGFPNMPSFTKPEVPGIADLLALLPAIPSPAIDIPFPDPPCPLEAAAVVLVVVALAA